MNSDTPELAIPLDVLRKWQRIVDLLAANEFFSMSIGTFCETVIKNNQPLLVANAIEDDQWKLAPEIQVGMISYLGSPFSGLMVGCSELSAFSMTKRINIAIFISSSSRIFAMSCKGNCRR